jgi:mycothiol synthase
MNKRQYRGEADLALLQDFNSAAIAVTDHCGYLHPGDIAHHLFSGNRSYDPAEITTIWEDDLGVAAWLMADLSHKSFDLQVRPDLRGNEFEREVVQYAENRTLELMRRHDRDAKQLYADAFRGDAARIDALKALGWELEPGMPYVLNRVYIPRELAPVLPEGFSFRSARGIEDAGALTDVHIGAFNSRWTPESYRKLMQTPGYAPERELVVEAPDGTFAAFCIIWFDRPNRIGLFEPVGTHKDYWRRGLGRALLLYGMQQMAAEGMTSASVAHFGDNEAARGLYQSCGFRPWHLEDSYAKHIEAAQA